MTVDSHMQVTACVSPPNCDELKQIGLIYILQQESFDDPDKRTTL